MGCFEASEAWGPAPGLPGPLNKTAYRTLEAKVLQFGRTLPMRILYQRAYGRLLCNLMYRTSLQTLASDLQTKCSRTNHETT